MSIASTLPFHSRVLLPELLDRNFFPVIVQPFEGENYISTLELIDTLVGFIKIPFIFWEANQMQNFLLSNQKIDVKILSLRSLSLLCNCFEFLTWAGERKILEIGRGSLFLMKRATFFGKTILYSYVCVQDSKTLYQIWALDPSQRERNALSIAQLQLASHVNYLVCMSFSFASLTLSIYFSKHLLQTLHVSSLLLDLYSNSLSGEEESIVGFQWKQS